MSASFNRVVLVGVLTSNPDIHQSSHPCATLTLGVNRWTKHGSAVDTFALTVEGDLVETCAAYLKRGSPILVDGRLRIRAESVDGERRRETDIAVSTLRLLARPPRDAAAAPAARPSPQDARAAAAPAMAATAAIDEAEIPYDAVISDEESDRLFASI